VLASSANFHGFGVCRAELSGLVLTSGTWAGLRGTATAKRAHLAVGALRKFRLTAPHPWLRRALQLQGPQRDSSAAQTHVRTVTDTARRRTCRGTHAWAQPRRGQACREGGGDARTHTQPFQCVAPSGARSTAPRRERGESRHSHPGAVAPAAGAAQRDGQPGACLHGARARRARPPLMRGRGRRCARGTYLSGLRGQHGLGAAATAGGSRVATRQHSRSAADSAPTCRRADGHRCSDLFDDLGDESARPARQNCS